MFSYLIKHTRNNVVMLDGETNGDSFIVPLYTFTETVKLFKRVPLWRKTTRLILAENGDWKPYLGVPKYRAELKRTCVASTKVRPLRVQRSEVSRGLLKRLQVISTRSTRLRNKGNRARSQ